MTVRDGHEEVRARLREAAEAHEPDRARMLARIERGMASPAGHPAGAASRAGHRATRRPVWGWTRVVAATAAVAGVFGLGAGAVALAVRGEDPAPGTVAVSPTPSSSPTPPTAPSTPSVSATPTTPVTPTAPTASATPTPPATPTAPTAPAAGNGVSDGPLWSDGSVDRHSNTFWAQSNVTLKTEESLSALTVRLRIAQTGGVTSAGAWRSLPEEDFTLTVAEDDGFLVYTWVLKEGRTVPAGTWVFAGQYDHERGGRDAGDDTYAATAVSGSQELSMDGDFAPQDD
ncbi:hypothetical protein J7I94_12400 [Streptomyces sp. ISL-12]|nr:hypothetical protein [Streptomyces sp. ISL-12]MBT2411361.1 hypothetical protein [Streptomyces sp. ISL-12]